MQAVARYLAALALGLTFGLLSSCGGGQTNSQAEVSDVTVGPFRAGVTPFIAFVPLAGSSIANVASIEYVIGAKPGSASKAVDVTYGAAALRQRGYLPADGRSATLPVFGLYAGYTNQVRIDLRFVDGSTQTLSASIATAEYSSIYSQRTTLVARPPGSALGFDFFVVKSGVGTPVVIDTDGEQRWAATGIDNSVSSVYKDYAFVIGEQMSTRLWRLELDGTMSSRFLVSPTYTAFHHNLDHGKTGYIAEVDAVANGVLNLESIAAEVDDSGAVLREWDFASLLGDHMRANGDDPSTLIRAGVDWFHMNSTTYDPRDDSVIVSSRENFVVKVDYRTGALIWILGDPTKYWYTIPSLRAKALTLPPGDFYPIGQHGLSVTADGLLLLFNNGMASRNNAAGTAAGESRTYSVVSAYDIDPVLRVAKERWRFDYGQTILSQICSSAFQSPKDKSVLVSYAADDNRLSARLVALDAARNVVFDFKYPSPVQCGTSWNAFPIDFHDLKIN